MPGNYPGTDVPFHLMSVADIRGPVLEGSGHAVIEAAVDAYRELGERLQAAGNAVHAALRTAQAAHDGVAADASRQHLMALAEPGEVGWAQARLAAIALEDQASYHARARSELQAVPPPPVQGTWVHPPAAEQDADRRRAVDAATQYQVNSNHNLGSAFQVFAPPQPREVGLSGGSVDTAGGGVGARGAGGGGPAAIGPAAGAGLAPPGGASGAGDSAAPPPGPLPGGAVAGTGAVAGAVPTGPGSGTAAGPGRSTPGAGGAPGTGGPPAGLPRHAASAGAGGQGGPPGMVPQAVRGLPGPTPGPRGGTRRGPADGILAGAPPPPFVTDPVIPGGWSGGPGSATRAPVWGGAEGNAGPRGPGEGGNGSAGRAPAAGPAETGRAAPPGRAGGPPGYGHMPMTAGGTGAGGRGEEHRRPAWLVQDDPESLWFGGLPPHTDPVIGGADPGGRPG